RVRPLSVGLRPCFVCPCPSVICRSSSVFCLSIFVRVLSVRVRPCFVCQCVWCVCVFLSSHLIMPQANLMELNKEENADHYAMSREEKGSDCQIVKNHNILETLNPDSF
uniref:Uncharacterized protein n=1 Tax=Meloidogyne incognita TaxID=6306 RepID=A0A914NQ64_MELIC